MVVSPHSLKVYQRSLTLDSQTMITGK